MRTPAEADIRRICTPVQYRSNVYDVDTIRSFGRGRRLLYLYSGPPRDMDAQILGQIIDVEVDTLDILRHASHDLSDQAIWESVVTSFGSRLYGGLLTSAPCGSFSVARTGHGGPSALRGELEPDIYGLPTLQPKVKEKVRLGTLLGIRAADVTNDADSLDIPGWLRLRSCAMANRPFSSYRNG